MDFKKSVRLADSYMSMILKDYILSNYWAESDNFSHQFKTEWVASVKPSFRRWWWVRAVHLCKAVGHQGQERSQVGTTGSGRYSVGSIRLGLTAIPACAWHSGPAYTSCCPAWESKTSLTRQNLWGKFSSSFHPAKLAWQRLLLSVTLS